MGRPSKLTDKQWADIEKRHLEGASVRSLAKEYKVADSTIRDRVSARSTEIKEVANQVIKAEERLYSLPISARVSAVSLIDELRAISLHIAGAAKFSAMTAHRLSGIAHGKTDEINEANPEESEDALKMVSGLTKMANMASEIPLNLLRANKDFVDSMNGDSELSSMSDAEIIAELESIRVSA